MTVSILLARTLVDAVAAERIDRDEFLAASGIDPKRLDDVAGRLDLVEYDALIQHALDVTSDAALGLHVLNDPAASGTYNVTAQLVLHSRSLREAIETLMQYYRLISDRPYWEIDEDEETATIRYRCQPGPPRARRFRAEFNVTALYKMVRYFARDGCSLVVMFDYPAPAYVEEYASAFGGPAVFDQPFPGMTIPRSLMDTTRPNGDVEFRSTMQVYATKKLAELDHATTYADRVTAWVTANPDLQQMHSVARGLGMSSRSLRRRLAKEGVVYTTVVERALASLATRLLVDERSTIKDIAYRLNFSEASTFCRAFKRWTGFTPKQYLAAANAGVRVPEKTVQ